MSNTQELAFKITADAESARAEIRRAADAVRNLGQQGGPAARGMGPLGDSMRRLRGSTMDADGALGVFTRNLASSGGPVSQAAAPIRGMMASLGQMPPLFVAASVAGTAFGAAIALALGRGIAAWRDYERQMLTTEQVIRSTGGAAGRSWEQIDEVARGIGQATLASTAEVRTAANQLLAFRSVATETFDRTLWAAQDLAAVGFGSITSAVQALGRAMEDPEQGLQALRRANVTFSASQRQTIRDMVEMGRTAEAQRLILERVEEVVGGAGRAAGGGLAGSFDTLSENLGEFFRLIGQRTAEVTLLQEALNLLAQGADRWNESMRPDPDGPWREVVQIDQQLDQLRSRRDEIMAGGMADRVPTVRAELSGIETQIAGLEARIAALQAQGRAQIEADADRLAASNDEQARQAEERFEGVIDALRREGEQAGLTATELRVLNEARRAGVVGNDEAVAKIREMVEANEALKNSQRATDLLGQLQQEIALRDTIRQFGADSVEAARARAAAERQAFEATVDALGVTGELRAEMMRAWEAARGLAGTNMVGPIAAARSEARAMADEIVRAIDAVNMLQASSAAALRDSEMALRYAGDTVGLAGARARERMLAAQGARRDGVEGGELAGLDAEVNAYVRRVEQAERNRQAAMERIRASRGGGGGGGGGSAEMGALQTLSSEAARILAELDIALGAINEKVQAGLLSSAEGVQAIGQANSGAADQMATLVARLEAIGPAGAAAAAQARQALQGLAQEARQTGETLQQTLADNFEESFARALTGQKDAFKSFADFIIMELTRAFSKQFITPLMAPLINALVSILPFAAGGVPDAPGLEKHANTVVTKPTMFPMDGGVGLMGEAGPEAILPVLRGPQGAGVRAVGAGGETVAPLTRMNDGVMGVEMPGPGADWTNADEFRDYLSSRMGGERFHPIAQREFAAGGVPTGATAILPVKGGRVRARGPDNREIAAPMTRVGAGLAIRMPTADQMMNAPLRAFAKGGIVGGGGSGGGGGGSGAWAAPGAAKPGGMVVNIHNNVQGAQVQAQERHEGGSSMLDIVFEQMESKMADSIARNTGPMAGALGAHFGLRRSGM